MGGDGAEVLLIAHATGFLGRVYRAFAEQLTDRFRIYAMDFRGHGDSTAPPSLDGFDWLNMAGDVGAVVDAIRDRHADADLHGFGHSMGGAAIIGHEHARPRTFTSATVFEPIIFPNNTPPGTHNPLEIAARARRPTFPSVAAALERYGARPPLGLFRADILHDYVTHGFAHAEDGSITLKCTPEHEGTTFAMAGPIHTDMLPDVDLTTMVCVSGDGQVPAQIAPVVAAALPNGRLETVDELTHFGPLQEPVTVARRLRAFVDERA